VAARLAALFAQPGGRPILVEHSGVDRARDSAVVFTAALLQARPALASLVRDGGANRYTLYFHKLKARMDSADSADSADSVDGAPQEGWRAAVFRASQDYQAYQASERLAGKLAAIDADPRLNATADVVLARLFAPAFLA